MRRACHFAKSALVIVNLLTLRAVVVGQDVAFPPDANLVDVTAALCGLASYSR